MNTNIILQANTSKTIRYVYMPGNEDKEWWELYEEREKTEEL